MQKIVPMNRRAVRTRRIGWYSVAKRAGDILLSSVMLLFLSPVLLAVAVVAAVDTKASPLFVQTRMGRGNTPFRMYKFRTMSPNTPANLATYKLHNADRYISRVGKLLRRTSLDELPQLWNILKGDMSFIGPRPVVLTEKRLLELRARNGAVSVRPGLTGWAQVNGRDDVPIMEKAMLDAYYSRRFSATMDIDILLRTVGCVFRGDGVTEGANPRVENTPTRSA